MPKKKLVLVVNQHPITAMTLGRLAESELQAKVIMAYHVVNMLDAVRDNPVDVMITDISMGTIEAIKQVISQRPAINILVVADEEELYAIRSLRAGAKGFIAIGSPVEQLVSAMKKVDAGGIHLSEKITQRALACRRPFADPVEQLSDMELKVYRKIGQGRPTRLIASELGISVKTVESHRANIKTKLGLKGCLELVRSAVTYCRVSR